MIDPDQVHPRGDDGLPGRPPPRLRFAFAIAAATATTALGSALLLSFHTVSTGQWAGPTPQPDEPGGHCVGAADQGQGSCGPQRVAAAGLASEPPPPQIASRQSAPDSGA